MGLMPLPLREEPFRVTANDMAAVLAHLLGLSADDRYGRFATPFPDSGIESYVSRIDLGQDICIGSRGTDGNLAGFIHLAVHHDIAELGASVCASWRRQGIARQLFLSAVQLAMANGISAIHLATGHPVARRIFTGMGYPCMQRTTHPRVIVELNPQSATALLVAMDRS